MPNDPNPSWLSQEETRRLEYERQMLAMGAPLSSDEKELLARMRVMGPHIEARVAEFERKYPHLSDPALSHSTNPASPAKSPILRGSRPSGAAVSGAGPAWLHEKRRKTSLYEIIVGLTIALFVGLFLGALLF